MATHNDLGEKGETLALNFLRKKGYQILQTNWRYGRNEVDIIAKFQGLLVIVEVKTRSSMKYGEPYISVTMQKQRALVRAAEAYIIMKNLDIETQFDIISIVSTPEKDYIEHIEDAFYPVL
ncbi:MAG: YraN family protein [Hyphomicrobiales bacterium]